MEHECITMGSGIALLMSTENTLQHSQQQLLLQTSETTFVMNCFCCRCGELLIRFVFSPAMNVQRDGILMNIQHDSILADKQMICMLVVDKHAHCCAQK